MNHIHDRTKLLLGEERFALLSKAKVLVIGLGGVGGTCALALARSGIRNLTLCDFDTVSESNLNRQVLYVYEDVGTPKAIAATAYLKRVNPEIDPRPLQKKVDAAFFEEVDLSEYDYVIDAIDDIPAKKMLAKACLEKNVPFLMSLGMANRLDSTLVSISRLDKTFNDPLAKKMRVELRKEGCDIKKIYVAFSSEEPVHHGPVLASMMPVPSSAGLALASRTLEDLLRAIDAKLSPNEEHKGE